MPAEIPILNCLNETIALESLILASIARQLEAEEVLRFPIAQDVLINAKTVLSAHAIGLSSHRDEVARRRGVAVKSAFSDSVGGIASLLHSSRNTRASSALRDDHAALSSAATSYTMLYTTALAYREHATAEIALRYLSDLTVVVQDCSGIILDVVMAELKDNDSTLSGRVLDLAKRDIDVAWEDASAYRANRDNEKRFGTSL